MLICHVGPSWILLNETPHGRLNWLHFSLGSDYYFQLKPVLVDFNEMAGASISASSQQIFSGGTLKNELSTQINLNKL